MKKIISIALLFIFTGTMLYSCKRTPAPDIKEIKTRYTSDAAHLKALCETSQIEDVFGECTYSVTTKHDNYSYLKTCVFENDVFSFSFAFECYLDGFAGSESFTADVLIKTPLQKKEHIDAAIDLLAESIVVFGDYNRTKAQIISKCQDLEDEREAYVGHGLYINLYTASYEGETEKRSETSISCYGDLKVPKEDGQE